MEFKSYQAIIDFAIEKEIDKRINNYTIIPAMWLQAGRYAL